MTGNKDIGEGEKKIYDVIDKSKVVLTIITLKQTKNKSEAVQPPTSITCYS